MSITNNRELARTARVIALLIAGSWCALAFGSQARPRPARGRRLFAETEKRPQTVRHPETKQQLQQQSAPKTERSPAASNKEETAEPATKKSQEKTGSG